MSSQSRNPGSKKGKPKPPDDVVRINAELAKLFDTDYGDNRGKVGNAKYGIYAFYDFDHEPIYVGQTREGLRTRIRRHLTNRRTDAVAMFVLDPFEVLEIEMWPLWDTPAAEVKDVLNAAEYTVFQKVLGESSFGAVLNEKDVGDTGMVVELPRSVRGCIIPDDLHPGRQHADTRIARRASTIAKLAQVISERDVSIGLRRTLLTQARRLEHLAASRFEEYGGNAAVEIEGPGEETGEDVS